MGEGTRTLVNRRDVAVRIAAACHGLEGDGLRAFLDAECRGDAELHREVLALLESGVKPRSPPLATTVEGSLAGESDVAVAAAGEEDLGPPPTLTKGALIGRYVVIEHLGSGGMGVVYAAFDPELDRKVAIKLVRPATHRSGSSGAARARLLREAQAIARVRHPAVIAVHDVGTFHDEVFVAMEYVEGRTLRTWLAERPRSWRGVVATLVRAGEGLAAAHDAGLVHRDFKPDNVLVGRDELPRVLDFGLARAAASASGETAGGAPSLEASLPKALETPITRTGAYVGTPAYMAPEQFSGESTDPRIDQFAFCVALYEGLYGERPFSGTSRPGLLASVRRGTLKEPPRSRSVPVWLRGVLARGLSTAPADRYPSMRALLSELKRDPEKKRRRNRGLAALGAAIITASWVGFEVRAREQLLCKREAPLAAGAWNESRRASVEAAFMATGLGYSADAVREVTRRLDAERTAIDSGQVEACEATRLRHEQRASVLDLRIRCLRQRAAEVDALVSLFEHADATTVRSAVASVLALPSASLCGDLAALEGPAAPPSDPAVLAKIDDVHARIARVDAMLAVGKGKEALPLTEETVPLAHDCGYAPVEAEAQHAHGLVLEDVGNHLQAKEAEERAYMLGEIGHQDAVRGSAAVALAHIIGVEMKRPEGEVWSDLAMAIASRRGDRRLEREVESTRAALYSDFEERLKHDERALQLAQSIPAFSPTDLAIVLENIGDTMFSLSLFEEARAHTERSRLIMEAELGLEHPLVGVRYRNLAVIDEEAGNFMEARREAERAIAIYQASYGSDSDRTTWSMYVLGNILFSLGELRKALELYRHHAEVGTRLLGSEDVSVAAVRSSVAHPLARLGHPDEARALAAEALALMQRLPSEGNDLLPYVLSDAANVELELGGYAKAAQRASEAIARFPESFGPEHHPNRAIAGPYTTRCKARIALGDGRGAADDGEKAARILVATIGERNAFTGAALACAGEAAAGLNDDRALPNLERAVGIFDAVPSDPRDRAAARFALARALETPDVKRAATLARRAREELTVCEDVAGAVPRLRERIARWFAAQ